MMYLVVITLINKYNAITEWLSTYPSIYEWVYFNASQMVQNNTSVNSVSSERKVEQFIDGSYMSELYFSITMIKGYDVETSTTNLDAMNEIENLMLWVDNDDNMSYLNFGADVTILDLDVVELTPTITVDKEQNLAKYQFRAKITYIQN